MGQHSVEQNASTQGLPAGSGSGRAARHPVCAWAQGWAWEQHISLLCSAPSFIPAWGWTQLGYQGGIPLFTAVEGVLPMALILKVLSNPVWDSVKDSCGKTEEGWRMKGKEMKQSSSSGSNLIRYLSVLDFNELMSISLPEE